MTLKDIYKNYQPDEHLLEAFVTYADDYGRQIYVPGYHAELQNLLKATIMQQLYGVEYKQRILNQMDPMIERTLQLARY